MLLTFLEADQPLVKAYARDSEGRLSKTSYPHAWQFKSHEVDVAGLPEFASELERHAALGHCLLKGNVVRQLFWESRAGSTDPNAETCWLCLDIDRLPGVRSPVEVLDALGCGRASFVNQYSSAYGIEPERGLATHIFMQFQAPVLPAALKLWLMWKNLTVPMLVEQLQLTKTNTALSWALDITTCQNDKLLYIAPPTLGAGIEVPEIERIEYVARSSEYLDLSFTHMPPAATIREMMEQKINLLREVKGLGSRKFAYKIDKTTGLEVLAKCDAATMTGIKRDRGFTYFNLNGGDSWGYWHADQHPEVIRNFKGEPDYLTSELLPEYWAGVQKEKKERDIAQAIERKELKEEIQSGVEDATGPRVLVFRDFRTATYWNGVWEPATNRLEMAQARSETQIQHFLKERGLPEVDFIPTWERTFDPHSHVRVDIAAKRINTWAPPKLVPTKGEFPVIRKLIEHSIGVGGTYDHYVNWLACAWRLRIPMQTAWTAHGVQGTGKGLLVHHVLIPLFGHEYVTVKRMEELEDQFNGYIENTLLVIVDEAQISDSKKSRMIMANLKNQITEPWVSIRRMHQEGRMVRNYTNWMFLSNMPDPVMIDASDRRFNVGVFQTERLVISDEEVAQIAEELPHFAQHLLDYEMDLDRARTVLQSEDRDRVIQTSKTSAELVAEALQKGQLDMFWEALPSGAIDVMPVQQQLMLTEYSNLVHAAVMDGKKKFTRDEIRVLFEYLCGDMPRTPTKFTQLLRHRNLHIKVMNIGGRAVRGLEVEWNVDPAWLEERRAELSVPRPKSSKEFA
jgi:hypothetical protein